MQHMIYDVQASLNMGVGPENAMAHITMGSRQEGSSNQTLNRFFSNRTVAAELHNIMTAGCVITGA